MYTPVISIATVAILLFFIFCSMIAHLWWQRFKYKKAAQRGKQQFERIFENKVSFLIDKISECDCTDDYLIFRHDVDELLDNYSQIVDEIAYTQARINLDLALSKVSHYAPKN